LSFFFLFSYFFPAAFPFPLRRRVSIFFVFLMMFFALFVFCYVLTLLTSKNQILPPTQPSFYQMFLFRMPNKNLDDIIM